MFSGINFVGDLGARVDLRGKMGLRRLVVDSVRSRVGTPRYDDAHIAFFLVHGH